MKVGSKEWCKNTGGALAPIEQLQLVLDLALLQGGELLTKLSNIIRSPKYLSPESIPLPKDKLSTAAENYLEMSCSPALKAHCFRSYYFGCLLGELEGVHLDHQAFYIACLLHDLGLGPNHCQNIQNTCFAVIGAQEAEEKLLAWGWSKEKAHLVYEAISLHLNMRPAGKNQPEARFLAQGAALDVVGARLAKLHPQSIEQVLTLAPRQGFAEEIVSTMQQSHLPRSRPAILAKLGFKQLALRCPLDEASSAPVSECTD